MVLLMQKFRIEVDSKDNNINYISHIILSIGGIQREKEFNIIEVPINFSWDQ